MRGGLGWAVEDLVKGPVERSRAPCSLLGASTGTLSADGWLMDREQNRYGNPPREAPPASGAVVSNLSDTVEEMPSGEHGGRRQELSLGPGLTSGSRATGTKHLGTVVRDVVVFWTWPNPEAHSTHSWHWVNSSHLSQVMEGLAALDQEMGPRLQGGCEDTVFPTGIQSVGVPGAV